MAHRSIEEVIDTIAPSRQRGIPNPPTISAGVSSEDGDLATSLSQAGQQIAQLQSAYQQQANLIADNTQALQSNTSSKSGSSGGSVLGGVASSLFGGALGFLSPIISGIASLFGGSSAPKPLPIYTPPPPVSITGALSAQPASAPEGSTSAAYMSQSYLSQTSSVSNSTMQAMLASPQAPAAGQAAAAQGAPAGSSTQGQSSYSPQVTVNISAMDSQSFLDRSDDIASAVRQAMLNMHPINNVVADL
jgi:hypothetical protein